MPQLPPACLPPHSHQTNHAQFSVMWSVEALKGERGGRMRWVLIHHLRRNNSWPKETEGREGGDERVID